MLEESKEEGGGKKMEKVESRASNRYTFEKERERKLIDFCFVRSTCEESRLFPSPSTLPHQGQKSFRYTLKQDFADRRHRQYYI
ncbi:hypothetical protein TNCV_2763831 [Trichonephila clavipes]|nr:hypothetical protein TNCV_2763831 [Trichonephila clavipes]